jgi:superfamily II DNA or RNA helicase
MRTISLQGVPAAFPIPLSNNISKHQSAIDTIISESLKGLSGLGRVKTEKDVNIFTFDQIVERYNKGITEDEMKAWVWYKIKTGSPMKGWEKYVIPKASETAEITRLVKANCLYYHDGVLMPYPIYAYGNMYDRDLQLRKDQDQIVSKYGSKVFENHEKVVEESKPKKLSFLNADSKERPKLLAISNFAADDIEFSISGFREDIKASGFSQPVSLKYAFGQYLSSLPKSVFDRVSPYDIWEFYVQGRNFPRYYSDESKENIQVNGPLEGEKLFARMLHEALTFEDQQKLDIIWNRKYNGWSNIPYYRIPIGFECSSLFRNGEFRFTPIQREAISFLEAAGSGIIAYDVGVGKTIAAIIAMANSIHQGKCQRPVVVVPNSVYKKWIREIFGYNDDATGEYVPGVLSGTGITCNEWYNLGSEKLKQLDKEKVITFDKKTGTYAFKKVPARSITVLTYEGLGKIGYGPDVMDTLFEELSNILLQVDGDEDTKSQRDIEKQREKMQEIIGMGNKGSICDIEQMGFDYLVIDEMHNFKNVFSYVPTDKEGNKRFKIEAAQSARAIRAFFLTNYIQRTYGANVVGLTATPFTNNPIEIYSMLSMVGYDSMQAMGVINLYSFMENFIAQSYEYVNNYDGHIVRKPVVKSFNNRVILQRLIYNHINYKTGDEAGVKRPCKINLPRLQHINLATGMVERLRPKDQLTTFIEMNTEQSANQAYINSLAQSGGSQAERMGNIMRALAKSLDNALSPYIFAKQIPETAEEFVDNSPKIKYVCECVNSVKMYHENVLKTPVSGQVIYSNRGKEYFKYIKEYLENTYGYKQKVKFDGSHVDEVEIITSGIKQDDREYIKEAFLNGYCKIIIGTATIREGIDLQKKGTVLYDMYPDWNPTDVKQLEGRIWRQGNEFGYVRIVMPLVQDSMDVFVFQKLEEKSSRVNDIWFRSERGNVLDVESLDPEEVKFALYTNLQELAKIVLEKEEMEIKKKITIIEEQAKVIKEINYSIEALKKARQDIYEGFMQARINLNNFEDIVKMRSWSWESYTDVQMTEFRERAVEYAKEIEKWLETTPVDDKATITLFNKLKMTVFVTKSVISLNSYVFDNYKSHVSVIANAERTVFQQRGYTVDTDFAVIKEEMNKEFAQYNEELQYVRSDVHMGEVVEQIQIKKQRNKVEGRIPEMAAEDFISLNHLLQYHFNVTDIENCIIPYPQSVPVMKPNLNLLRMRMKAKALKLKLQLN